MTEQTDEVVFVLEVAPAPGRHDEVLRLMDGHGRRAVSRRVGCRSYLVRDQEPEGSILVIGKWDSERQLLDYLEGPPTAEILESMVGLLVSPPVPRIIGPRPG